MVCAQIMDGQLSIWQLSICFNQMTLRFEILEGWFEIERYYQLEVIIPKSA